MTAPAIRSQRTAIVVGLAGFGVGWWGLWQAFEGRGRPTPRPLRPFTWW